MAILTTNFSTGLIVDNGAPDAPIINAVLSTDTIITGTAETLNDDMLFTNGFE